MVWRGLTLVLLGLAGGCSLVGAPARGHTIANEMEFHCARATMGQDSPYRMPLAGAEENPVLAARLLLLPPQARRAALAAGLEPLLARLFEARAVSTGDVPSGTVLAVQQELNLRLVAFHAQLSAAAFEAGCTADMIQKELADQAELEHHRQTNIAVGSLAVGALAGVVAGIWGLVDRGSDGPAIMAIAGGAAGTALGAAALTHRDWSMAFNHGRNRLTPVWLGVDPDHLYPSFVFRMLTLPAGADGRTPRDELLAAWQERIDRTFPAMRRDAVRDLLLGQGGVYDEDLLTIRAEMFEGLESAVHGMARDLELLNRSLVRTLTGPSEPPREPARTSR